MCKNIFGTSKRHFCTNDTKQVGIGVCVSNVPRICPLSCKEQKEEEEEEEVKLFL
jgi:hypothetical protein